MFDKLKSNSHIATIKFAEHELLLNSSGSLYWPSKKTLIIADLHFEKGSYLAQYGQPIPLYDTTETLEKIEKQISYFQPERLICLGDNMHDIKALQRMQHANILQLGNLKNSVGEWIWIIGNHDIKDHHLSINKSEKCYLSYQLDNILFRHDYHEECLFQVIGHFHPKKILYSNGHRITGKCFIVDKNIIILPSFGCYTGGLDSDDKAFHSVVDSKSANYYLIYKDKIFRVK